MYCVYVLTIASLKLFVRNRQALFFSLFMPMIILFIFGSMNFDQPSKLHVGLATHAPTATTKELLKHMRSIEALSVDEGTLDSELAELRNGNRSIVLDVPDDLLSRAQSGDPRELNVYVNSGRPIEAQAALTFINQFVDKASMAVANVQPLFIVKQQKMSAKNFRYIDFLLPGLIAMSVMQMSVFSVAFVFAQYKEKGILKRILATPVRPVQFVMANILTRLLVALVQAAIFVILGIQIFHTHVAGSWWLLAASILLGSLTFLGLGFTISGISKTVETVPVLANILVFPMLFLGNVFFSISNTPPWLQSVAKLLPLTLFSNALHGVMTEGEGLYGIRWDIGGLFIWAAALTTLATITFRFQERDST